MADKKLMIDTSILIDYFRKKDKSKSRLVSHFREYDKIFISTITEFEIFNGASEAHKEFWETLLASLIVLDFNRVAARQSAKTIVQLKSKRKTIDKPDLFITATAIAYGLRLDTLNTKHSIDIENLNLLTNLNNN